MKKFGIALGSGGARGIAHLGFLEVLKEKGVKIDCICGASMGAIVGGLFCSGADIRKLLEILEKLKKRDIVAFDVMFYKSCGLTKNDKAMSLLEELFGDKRIEETEIPFCCSALDLISGKTVRIKEGLLSESVLASSSVPGIFPPVKIGDYLFVDGGVVNKVPVEMCREMGADVVLGVDALGEIEIEQPPKNIAETVQRAFLIMNYHTGVHESNTADKLIVLDQKEIDPAKVENLLLSYEIGRKTALMNFDEIKEMEENCHRE